MKRSAPWAFFHPSNAVSYLSLAAGLGAVHFSGGAASDGVWGSSGHAAGASLTVAVLADILDGKFARLFKRTPELAAFGGQLDSLCDAVVFGAVPVICLARLDVPGGLLEQALFCTAALFYVIAAVTRLGYYNLLSAESGNFTGLPTTLAGLAWAILFFLEPAFPAASALLVLTGSAMVAPFGIRRPGGKGLLVVIAVILAVGIGHVVLAGRSG